MKRSPSLPWNYPYHSRTQTRRVYPCMCTDRPSGSVYESGGSNSTASPGSVLQYCSVFAIISYGIFLIASIYSYMTADFIQIKQREMINYLIFPHFCNLLHFLTHNKNVSSFYLRLQRNNAALYNRISL